jgi:hypothetical protein
MLMRVSLRGRRETSPAKNINAALTKALFVTKVSFPVRRWRAVYFWGVGDLTGERHDNLTGNLFWSDASVDAIACSVGIIASHRSARGDLAPVHPKVTGASLRGFHRSPQASGAPNDDFCDPD